MKYEFQAVDGEIIEREYRMKDAPAFGTTIEVDGKFYERIASLPQVNGNPIKDRYPVVSESLPRGLTGVQCDSIGRPVIHNADEHRRVAESCGLIHER
jgi:hypothetical protein